MPTELRIRPAEPREAAVLHALTIASKGLWGYPADVMRDLDRRLDVAADLLRDGRAAVAERHGRVAGWAQVLAPRERVSLLDHLWVAPWSMRAGVGSALFRRAAADAREMGAAAMEWEADPNAAGFYARMGGRTVRAVISEWGRKLDVMAVELER